jgi:Cu/Ag efflux pump CusA
MAIESAIGGANVTTTIEGRERYPVNVRYQRAYRGDLETIRRTLISTPGGAQIPMGEVADITAATGPMVLRTEQAQLLSYVYVDVGDRDIGSYVEEAKAAVAKAVTLPPGYTLEWSGQYEYMQRSAARLKIVIPITLALVIVLLYLNTRNATKVGIVLLAVPFSLVGAFWLLWILGYNLSVAVWVGIIALAGVDAETGVVMLLYLDQAYEKAKSEGPHGQHGRPAVRRRRWRRQADTPEDDDRDGHLARPPSHHVESRDRIGRHEANRRADGRRRRHVLRPRAAHLPSHLHGLEMAPRGEGRCDHAPNGLT